MRYWKVIFITVVIIGSIGTYYVKNALAESEYPEFVFETTSGDASEVEPITLSGYFGNNQRGMREQMDISAEDTIYQGEMSYFRQLGFYYDPVTERLQSEYRNFMRGKGESALPFFENDDVLVYVGPYWINEPDTPFDVEILNKETGDVTTFEVDIPDSEGHMFINLADVQLLNGELHVITTNVKRGNINESDTEEAHVYRIDIENGQLVSDEVLFSNEDGTDTNWFHVSDVNRSNDVGPKDYYVFHLNHMEGDRSHSSVHEKSEYVAYHFETGELMEMDLPEEMEVGGFLTYTNQGSIYFIDTSNNDLEIKVYDMEKKELYTIDVQITEDTIHPANVLHVQDGKIYLVNYYPEEQTNLYVFDVITEDVLYEGKIKFENPEEVPEDYYLDFFELKVE